ncbi:hypothetical protein NFI96_021586 [Prochilodus magdalenae]|nr:hypothetical protein NFI96_021586 [Prochilodus magdalenae]
MLQVGLLGLMRRHPLRTLVIQMTLFSKGWDGGKPLFKSWPLRKNLWQRCRQNLRAFSRMRFEWCLKKRNVCY